MKHFKLILALLLATSIYSCKESSGNLAYSTNTSKDANGHSYETVENDPTGLRLYTLDNGLKVYLSKNTDEPKIQTYIAVRAGSNYDPKESTGLAHYLDRAETNPDKKLAIYKEIDKVSLEASNYSVANEYDKMTSSLGATGTNAHTWFEETVYKNKIPANELDKWLDLEAERFGELVLRLFHTELEAVFEEFNRGQDNDGRY